MWRGWGGSSKWDDEKWEEEEGAEAKGFPTSVPLTSCRRSTCSAKGGRAGSSSPWGWSVVSPLSTLLANEGEVSSGDQAVGP